MSAPRRLSQCPATCRTGNRERNHYTEAKTGDFYLIDDLLFSHKTTPLTVVAKPTYDLNDHF